MYICPDWWAPQKIGHTMNASLILTANDQSYEAWKDANKNHSYFTRVDILGHGMYARIGGIWKYIA